MDLKTLRYFVEVARAEKFYLGRGEAFCHPADHFQADCGAGGRIGSGSF